MKRLLPVCAALAAIALGITQVACVSDSATATESSARNVAAQAQLAALSYPPAKTADQVDEYHGVEIADPYRWLEESDSEQTQAWVKAQDQTLKDFLGDDRDLARFEARFLAIQHFESVGVPVEAGAHRYYTRTPAGEMDPSLWRSNAKGEERLVLSADRFLGDGQQLMFWSPDPGGRYLALTIAPSDSYWGKLRIFDAVQGKMLPYQIDGLRGGVSWLPDGSGFYYIGYGESDALRDGATPNTDIRFHKIGRQPSRDASVLQPDDDALYSTRVTHEGRFLVITRWDGSRAREEILLHDIAQPEQAPLELITGIDARFSFEGSEGDRFFFMTNLDAPRYRVIAVDRKAPAREQWQELIPESEHAITAVNEVGDALVLRYSEDARHRLSVFALDGEHRYDVKLPKLGWLGGVGDNRRSEHVYYRLTTMADPGTVYRFHVVEGKSSMVSRPDLAYDPDAFAISQIFYESKDGTRVPMFVAHHKDVQPSEHTPLFLYGYGHGGWSAWPWYQPRIVGWMESGGVYALPGLRGGGEYGASWQAAGTAEHKENTIDDYFAAADWLVDQGYTSYPRLVMNGGSASGVLPAIALTRRPDKLGAAMVDIPFLDMLRYHHTIAFPSWIRGYGSSEDPTLFPILRGYSPYHNVEQDRCYPPTMVQVGEVDETTPPLHGYKFIAAMQAAQGCPQPVLLKTAWGAKHNAGATRAQRAETWAQQMVFLSRAVGLPGSTDAGQTGP